jgi:PhzF family phenazine biosynthesis protein
MNKKIYIVDSFTNKPFAGNPAAVYIHDEPLEDSFMLSIANELNLSETAFVQAIQEGFALRWFTPATEVELCGHATLAAAHILYEQGIVSDGEEIAFHTLSGQLGASRKDGLITLDFPQEAPQPVTPPSLLLEAILAEAVYIGKNRFDYVLELDSAAAVRSLSPDFVKMAKVESRGVIVTARSDQENFDIISRCFYPQVGINEDPVTGSAHCALGPYWQAKLKKDSIQAYQASSRGGEMLLEMKNGRILLKGNAVSVFESRLLT